MPCKTVETSPLFSQNNSVSGTDFRRDKLIRAWYGLVWLSHYLALSSDSPNDSQMKNCDSFRNVIRADNGRFRGSDGFPSTTHAV